MTITDKLSSLQDDLTAQLTAHKGSTCLFLSGGMDSTLLLLALIKIKAQFSVMCFDANFTRRQKSIVARLIKKYDLRVFTYPPVAAYLVGDGAQVTMIEEYAFGREVFPFLRDCVSDEARCAKDLKIFAEPRPTPIAFSLNIVGTRKFDRHYALKGRLLKERDFAVGGLAFTAPLFDWTRREVREALKTFGTVYKKPNEQDDTGNLPMCLNCLTGKGQVFCPKQQTEIDAVEWQPQEMLRQFRSKYGVV